MKRKLLRVGLTGGIGSGKSTVASLLQMMGAAVYEADSRAKRLMTEDALLRAAITEAFGPQSYAGDGSLERAYLAAQVFGNPERLAGLNALVHPAVARDFDRWAEELASEGTVPYVVEEAAILIESGAVKKMDRVVAVVAPVELRIRRVMQRSGIPREEALKRVEAQITDSERLPYADYVVVADDRQLLIPQVVELHAQLCAVF